LLFRGRDNDSARKQDAIAALYETHFERVARYISVRIGDINEAEDLASEVFIRAIRSVASFKDTGAPMEAWVFKIAHNIVVDHLRKKQRRPATTPIDETHDLANDDNPVEQAEHKEELERVTKAMEHLTEGQRQVLGLRFGSEMTAEEVAKVMNKKPGAVREMQSAAVKKLRDILQSEDDK
jgi:RNA polymerase sigma-70 factor (ECF subfamily)